MRVDQFTPVLAPRDAIGGHVLALHRLLTELGVDSRIHAARVADELVDVGRDFRDHEPGADLLVYHASTGSPVADHVAARPEPLVVDYHNITPAEFFEPWEPHIAAELDHGRRQLRRLARRAVLGLGDSAFNVSELVEVGFERVGVA
ncbi:MAG: hypothetical protein D6683_04560, partial [Actinomyces sp.]